MKNKYNIGDEVWYFSARHEFVKTTIISIRSGSTGSSNLWYETNAEDWEFKEPELFYTKNGCIDGYINALQAHKDKEKQ